MTGKTRRFRFVPWGLLVVVWLTGGLVACSQNTEIAPTEEIPLDLSVALTELAATLQQPALTASPAPTDGIPQSTPEDPGIISPLTAKNLRINTRGKWDGAESFIWIPGEGEVAVAAEGIMGFYTLSPSKSWDEVAQVQSVNPSSLAVAKDASLAAWIEDDKRIHLWDVSGRREFAALGESTTAITGLAFAPDSKTLAVSTLDQMLTLWRLPDRQSQLTWQTPAWVTNISFSPDGSQIAGVDLAGFRVYIWDAALGQEIRQIHWDDGVNPALYGVHFSPDWRWIAWVTRAAVQLVDVNTQELGPLFVHDDFVSSVAWGPYSQLLATAAASQMNGELFPVVQIWDIQTGNLLNTLVQSESVLDMQFSPDGHDLAILTSSGLLQVWTVR